MLVLSRKVGEKFLIGDSISITVVRISGGGVRIGIEAPKEMPVVREELANQVDQTDQQKAAVVHQDTVIGADQNSSFKGDVPGQPR